MSGLRGETAGLRSDLQDLRRLVELLGHRLDTRIDAMDGKMSRQFTRLAGMQVALLMAFVSALVRFANP